MKYKLLWEHLKPEYPSCLWGRDILLDFCGQAMQNCTAYANSSGFNHSGRAGSIREPH